VPETLTETPTGPKAEIANDTPEAVAAGPASDDAGDEVLTDDLLVEEVSIDGMCGVY
jgi:mycofactocin precursor